MRRLRLIVVIAASLAAVVSLLAYLDTAALVFLVAGFCMSMVVLVLGGYE